MTTDPLLTPITSKLPGGLTLTTMYKPAGGIMAGQLIMNVGTHHAGFHREDWVGLPHAAEHMYANGASRNFGPDEAMRALRDSFYLNPNACTGPTATRYFTTMTSDDTPGYVLPKERFFDALGVVLDGVFFPKFDDPTWAVEQGRILEETAQGLTQYRMDQMRASAEAFAAPERAWHNLGSIDLVKSFTPKHFHEFHQWAYGLNNACLSIVGDISHAEAVAKVTELLRDVPLFQAHMPKIPHREVQNGEFRFVKPGANPGFVDAWLLFTSPNLSQDGAIAQQLAVLGLSHVIEDVLMKRYTLYTANAGYSGYLAQTPNSGLHIVSNDVKVAPDALAYALDLAIDPKIHAQIIGRTAALIDRVRTGFLVHEPSLGVLASQINDLHNFGAQPMSKSEMLGRFTALTEADIAGALQYFTRGNMFLRIEGHPGSLDVIPPVTRFEALRSSPTAAAGREITAQQLDAKP